VLGVVAFVERDDVVERADGRHLAAEPREARDDPVVRLAGLLRLDLRQLRRLRVRYAFALIRSATLRGTSLDVGEQLRAVVGETLVLEPSGRRQLAVRDPRPSAASAVCPWPIFRRRAELARLLELRAAAAIARRSSGVHRSPSGGRADAVDRHVASRISTPSRSTVSSVGELAEQRRRRDRVRRLRGLSGGFAAADRDRLLDRLLLRGALPASVPSWV
jgi:hypothetical protein